MNPIGACLIRGHEKSAQPWLIHRLLTNSLYVDLDIRPKRIDCASRSQSSCLKKRICEELYIDENSTVETILDMIIRMLKTQSVVFILKDVHATTSQAVEEFLVDFWQPLVKLYPKKCKTPNLAKRLVFILVALDGVSGSWEVSCSQFPHELYPLTKIEPLSCDEIRENLQKLNHKLSRIEKVPEEDSKKVLMLLENERSLAPQGQEDLLRYVYEECYGLKWTDFERRWKHHYS